MLDELLFQVLSFLFVMLGIGVILIVIMPANYALDRFWPSHPRGIRGHETLVTLANLAALPLLILVVVLVT